MSPLVRTLPARSSWIFKNINPEEGTGLICIPGILVFIITLLGVQCNQLPKKWNAAFILCPMESLINLVHALAENGFIKMRIEGTTNLIAALCPFHITSHSFYHLLSQYFFLWSIFECLLWTWHSWQRNTSSKKGEFDSSCELSSLGLTQNYWHSVWNWHLGQSSQKL